MQKLGEALQRLANHEDVAVLSEEEKNFLIVEAEKALVLGPLGSLLAAITEARHEEIQLLALLERQELIREHTERAMKGHEQFSFRAIGGQKR